MNSNLPAPPRILSKLSRVEVSTLPPADAAFLLLALESNGIECRAKWRVLSGLRRPAADNRPASVALSALCHLMAAPRGMMDAPPAAALAHLRWVWNRIGDDDTSPEAAFWFALAASRLPRSVFTTDSPPLPVNWRDRVASEIVGRQSYNPRIRGFSWGDDAAATRPTAFAVLALLTIANN